jgi:hypothetical protein
MSTRFNSYWATAQTMVCYGRERRTLRVQDGVDWGADLDQVVAVVHVLRHEVAEPCSRQ